MLVRTKLASALFAVSLSLLVGCASDIEDVDEAGEGTATTAVSGTVDTSFGDKGFASLPLAVTGAERIFEQQDGKVLVGSSGAAGKPVTLVRFLENGKLDTAFGKGGTVAIAPPADLKLTTTLREVDARPDGTIVVLLARGSLRLRADGSLDTSYGEGGYQSFWNVIAKAPNKPSGTTMPLYTHLRYGEAYFAVARLGETNDVWYGKVGTDGRFDASYGNRGFIKANFKSDALWARDFFVDDRSQLMVVGPKGSNAPEDKKQTYAARFTKEGKADGTFGDRGILAVKDGRGGSYRIFMTDCVHFWAESDDREDKQQFGFDLNGKILVTPRADACASRSTPEFEVAVDRRPDGGSVCGTRSGANARLTFKNEKGQIIRKAGVASEVVVDAPRDVSLVADVKTTRKSTVLVLTQSESGAALLTRIK